MALDNKANQPTHIIDPDGEVTIILRRSSHYFYEFETSFSEEMQRQFCASARLLPFRNDSDNKSGAKYCDIDWADSELRARPFSGI